METEVNSVEINVRQEVIPGASAFAGFRYLNIEDTFNIETRDDLLTRRYDTQTENNLYGLQLGGAMEWQYGCCGRLSYGFQAKAGVYIIDAEQVQRNYTPGGATLFTVDYEETSWASTVEFGFVAKYALNCRTSIRAGYDVMFWNGLALAPEQLNDSVDGSEIHLDGNIIADGAFIGLEIRN